MKTLFIEPGSPWENGTIKCFNGKLRDKLLEREAFDTLLEAKTLIERWRQYINRIRPQSALGYRLPAPEAWQPRAFAWRTPQQPHGAGTTSREQISTTFNNPDVAVQHAASEGFKPNGAIGSLRSVVAVRRRAIDFLLVDRLMPIQLRRDHRLRCLLSFAVESRCREVDVECLPDQRRQARIRDVARVGKNTSRDARRGVVLRHRKLRRRALLIE